MRCAAPFQSTLRLNPILVLIATLGLLTMPVDYRAGSSLIHPHSTVQLLGDLANGTHNHHGSATEHDHAHGHWHPRPDPMTANPDLTVDQSLIPAASVAIQPTPAVVRALLALVQPGDEQHAADDLPLRVSTAAGGKATAFSVLPPVALLLLSRWHAYRSLWTRIGPAVEQFPRPEPPPPRPLSA